MKANPAEELRKLPVSEIHGTVTMSADMRDRVAKALEQGGDREVTPAPHQEPIARKASAKRARRANR